MIPRLILLWLLVMPFDAFSQANVPSLDGVWRTGARDGSWGFVTFGPCGDAICGTLIGGGGANVDPQYFGTALITGMR